ncbi:hypothetical protein [Abyssisolibacter fermentans]|uniref:hypothetical protein n=1 Tax=Abyssisolibacter fermentans TaxID=1766203 RepID=UPI000834DC38|nr:hypothetical protein [Abyssisolibacter fermentans]
MMKINKKQITSLVLAVVILVIGCGSVFATSYTSYLTLSINSSHDGAWRDYVGSTHKIALEVTKRDLPTTYDNHVDITLVQDTWLGNKDRGSKIANLKELQTYNYKFYSQDDGTFRYEFFNGWPATDQEHTSDSFTCKTVTMSSY